MQSRKRWRIQWFHLKRCKYNQGNRSSATNKSRVAWFFILNLEKDSGGRHNIVLTVIRLILPNILPIVLWCKQNQVGSSSWLMLWIICTYKVMKFIMCISMQTIVRRFDWGIVISLENLRERTLSSRRHYMVSSPQGHNLDRLLLVSCMK